jgi:hypothetical protein
MQVKHAFITVASVAALGLSALAAAENPERETAYERQLWTTPAPVPAGRAAIAREVRESMAAKPFVHGFHKLSPDEETFDAASEMDPHIGRHQDMNAQN